MKLRILTYPWHTGHQYELFKLPFHFLLYQGADSAVTWSHSVRPLPWNARFIEKLERKDVDLAILPFDENVLTPTIHQSPLTPHWGNVFLRLLQWCRDHCVPAVGLCHGTVPRMARFLPGVHENWNVVDKGVVQQFRAVLKGIPVVCNSKQAFAEWGFEGRAIIHGFDPREYPLGLRQSGVLITAANILTNNYFQGGWILEHCAGKIRLNLLGSDHRIGSDTRFNVIKVPDPGSRLPGFFRKRFPHLEKWLWAREKFREYRKTIGSYSVYLNATQFSTMPRSRAEAMLCGLAVVTTPYYDIDQYVVHGKSGFLFREAEEAVEILQHLLENRDACLRMGLESRKTAEKAFHIDRYLSEWRALIRGL